MRRVWRDALGGEELAAAEEILLRGAPRPVGEELRGPRGPRSPEQVRGGGPELVREDSPDLAVGELPSRRRCERIVPSCRQPRLVTTRLAASL